MNTPSNDVPESIAPAVMPATRPMVWSVRRELWENRSIYLAPLIVATVVVLASLVSTIGLPRKMRNLPTLDPAKQHAAVIRPFSMAPAPIMLATFLVGFFYCLDALYGERRDRSILFWKSLPVSDRTTVLSKATIPVVVLPTIAFVLSVIAQVVMLFWSTLVLIGSGIGPARLWNEFHFIEGLPVMAFGLIVHVLWFAPIYGWLFLISAWARRAPFLWAVLPPMAVSFVERIVFNTSYFVSLLRYRATGAMVEAFDYKPSPNAHGDFEHLSQLHPLNYLSSPGLWLGLMFAAACLAAVVRLRRNREPI